MKWIDEQLEARGINRRELADAIGFTEAQMSKVMNGHRRLTANEADKIRRFFGYRLPDDPPESDLDVIEDHLARLGAGQIRAVVLYLEALQGSDQERPQAS